MRLRLRSVRVRLTLWYACVLALILAGFSGAVYLLVRNSLLHEVAERAEQGRAVLEGLAAEAPMEPAEIEEHAIVPLFALQHEGGPGYASTAWRRQGLPDVSRLVDGSSLRRWTSTSGASYAIASATKDVDGQRLAIAVAVDEGPALEHLRTLALVLLLGLPAAIAAAVVGGSLLAKRALSPVGAMAAAAARITAERLSERLPIEDPDDEFGRLAGVFNQTLARLQDAFERLRRFTADASHELRTPLTALRSVGEVALRAPDFHDRCRDTVASMLEESERLTQLVDGLLTLTRESTDAFRARFAGVELGSLSTEVVELFRPLAEEGGQRLELRIEIAVSIHGDRITLRQALVNLVDNALKYTPRGGSIQVVVRAEGDDALVEVVDDGPGIAEQHRELVFDRFYRIDDDRSRTSGGAGLGLAIARWAVELNGGRIELDSAPGRGSTFRLRIPRLSAAAAARTTSEGADRKTDNP